MKTLLILTALSASPAITASYQTPIPTSFVSTEADRQQIETLLKNYTDAVSHKDQALFESLLLDKSIPFSGVPIVEAPDRGKSLTSNYEQFRKAVFEGKPFTQRFENVRIEQDGALAQVSLVFVNTAGGKTSWGWKSMQLLKDSGRWKIAAELFTDHD